MASAPTPRPSRGAWAGLWLGAVVLVACTPPSAPAAAAPVAEPTKAVAPAPVPAPQAAPIAAAPAAPAPASCEHPEFAAKCSAGWCEVPAGCFVMGSPEVEFGRALMAEEQARVTLTHRFVMAQHETTQAEWTALGLPNPSGKNADGSGDCLGPDCPVGNVTWFDALAYANRLSETHTPALAACYQLSGCTGTPGHGLSCTGVTTTAKSVYECEGFRLPTDAEWEYAARAGTSTAFYSGDIAAQPTPTGCGRDPALDKIAWYCKNAGKSTHPVAKKKPNRLGLYDMSGNVDELVSDPALGVPLAGPVTDPGAPLNGDKPTRITRGGIFVGWPSLCRSANRSSTGWNQAGPGGGFRLVRTVE